MAEVMRNLGDNLIFAEDFHSRQTVRDNGGVSTGSAQIRDGYISGGSSYVQYGVRKLRAYSKLTVLIEIDGYLAAPADYEALVSQYFNSPLAGFDIGLSGTLFYSSFRGGAGGSISTSLAAWGLFDGGKHTIVVTCDGTNQYVYVDGVFKISAASSVGDITGVGQLEIGSRMGLTPMESGHRINKVKVFNDYWTSEEVLDAYQQDTYQEIDSSLLDVDLPLRSWFTKETGSELLVDGDMEAAGVGSWTAGSGATLTKQTTSPYSGLRLLRVAGTAPANAYQTILTIGKKYRVTGWMRSDGVATPRATDAGGAISVIGTTSTSWQRIDVTGIASNAGYQLRVNAGTGYVEFDDVSIYEVLDQTKNLGTAGNFLLGDGHTVAGQPTQLSPKGMFLDTTQYLLNSSVEIASTKSWSVSFLGKHYDIAGSSTHRSWAVGAYASNGILLNQYGSNLYFYWNSAAITWNGGSGYFKNGIHSYTITSNGGVLIAYRDGEYFGTADLSAKAALAGSYPVYYGYSSASAEADLLGIKMKFGEAFTPRQVRNLHRRFLESLNK